MLNVMYCYEREMINTGIQRFVYSDNFCTCSRKKISFQNEEKKGMILFVQGGEENLEIDIWGLILSNRMILEPHTYTVAYL